MAPGRDALIELACRGLGRLFSTSPVSFSPPTEARRVLILKPCCLGDVLLSTPAIVALRRRFPNAWLAYAVGDWARAALAGNPHLDAILPCRVRGGERPRPGDYLRTVEVVRRGRFDLCFVLDRSPLITALPYLAGIPRRVGIDSDGRGFSLTVRVPWNDARHEAELYLDTLRAVGVGTQDLGLEFYPTDDDVRWARARLEALGPAPADRVRVVVHPGGGVNPGMRLLAKRWTTDGYAALLRRVLEMEGQAVLVGGDSDAQVIAEVLEKLGETARRQAPLTLSSPMSLGQLGAVIQQCDLFVGNDTGPMHLAVAVGTPVVAVFGPSSPDMYGPYSSRARTVYRRVPCSPCFVKGRYARDCREHLCMRAVSVDDVWEAALDLVPNLSGSPRK